MARSSELATYSLLIVSAAQPAPSYCKTSDGRREQLVDDGEEDQKHQTDAEARDDQLLFDRQQRLDLRLTQFLTDIHLRHGSLLCSAGQRRFDAAEEQPGNQQADPDHETEQANEIHRGEPANALLP